MGTSSTVHPEVFTQSAQQCACIPLLNHNGNTVQLQSQSIMKFWYGIPADDFLFLRQILCQGI